ncbi:MAG: hypothetical protein WA354_01625, partial [Terracidiphilus sp.]
MQPDSFPKDGGVPLQTQKQNEGPAGVDVEPRGFWISIKQMRTIGWTSAMLALLQSLCTAVLTVSGIRVA